MSTPSLFSDAQELLPFDPRFKNWADVDMWMRVCGLGGVAFVDQSLITLDNSPTPVRKFSFSKNALIQQMTITNIQRMFSGSELRPSIKRQQQAWRLMWVRWMLGGLKNFDFSRIKDGLKYHNL